MIDQDLHDDVKRILFILEGDPKDRSDSGMVGDVKDNTRFRLSSTKVIWTLVLSMVGAYGIILAQALTN